MRKILNVRELAQALRVSLPVAYEAVRSGKVAAVRIGSQWRISEASVDSFLAGGSTKPRPTTPVEAGK